MVNKNNAKQKIEADDSEEQEIIQNTDAEEQGENTYTDVNNEEVQSVEPKKSNVKVINAPKKNSKPVAKVETKAPAEKKPVEKKKENTNHKKSAKESKNAEKKQNKENKKESKDKKKSKLVPIIIGIIIVLAIIAGIYYYMNTRGQVYTNIIISKVDTANGIQFVADKDGPLRVTEKDLATTETFYKLQGMNLNAEEILNQTILRKILLNNAVKYAPNDSVVKAQNDAMFAEFDKAPEDLKNMTLAQVNLTLPKLKEISLVRLKEDLTIKNYIEKEILVYLPQEKAVNASHVLICFQGAYMCKENRTKTEALALATKVEGLAKTQDFGKLAAQYSDEPGANMTLGNLGFFQKGSMVPEFENAAFTTSIGEVSAPVETTFGYHIIKVFGTSEVPSQTEASKIQYTLFSQVLEKAYN